MSATVSSNNRRAGAATAIAALAAFNVYSCMYAFRKPYSAATYSEFAYWGLSLKVWLVLAQTLGYAVSKFIGIRYISELNPQNRLRSILGLIGTAWLALLGFALVPPPWNIIFLFVNGIPLGLVFGIVFSLIWKVGAILVFGCCPCV